MALPLEDGFFFLDFFLSGQYGPFVRPVLLNDEELRAVCLRRGSFF